MAKCGSCTSRKGKRNCPAFNDMICSQCCGKKRKVEINCPDHCSYLSSSKAYLVDREAIKKLSLFDKEMQSIIGNEEPYQDLLKNIESRISKFYQERGNISDRDVRTVLEYMMEVGKVQLKLPSTPATELSFKIQSLVDAIDDVIKIRSSIGQEEDLIIKLKCIYCILDSIKTHYNPKDERNYLKFIGSSLET